MNLVYPGVTGHGSGGASILRILSPPGDSVLGQKLLPQGESSPCIGTLALGYFLRVLGRFFRRSFCPRAFPPAEYFYLGQGYRLHFYFLTVV